MTNTDWTISFGILTFVLLTVLGTRQMNRMTFVRIFLTVGGSAFYFLNGLPTAGHDVLLELGGAALGVVFGVLAGSASTVFRQDNRVMVKSGWLFAGVWVAALGLRVAFAELATSNPAVQTWVVNFSIHNQITGPEAWRAAFVLMALVMVVTRVALVAVRVQLAQPRIQTQLA
ncbi:hypothetical protein [Deinococcus altitudinis]|uniref:hypothetical protein n=1 Tax=Deinococcus altitudinis TaxID=468914 RepID=UPI0038920BAE